MTKLTNSQIKIKIWQDCYFQRDILNVIARFQEQGESAPCSVSWVSPLTTPHSTQTSHQLTMVWIDTTWYGETWSDSRTLHWWYSRLLSNIP